ncbi:hypothetical protein LTR50_000233 [Elasticomyces elasticus]|nr:hypothetical protein LTR50_000233 [Elasticomyces elasticus]
MNNNSLLPPNLASVLATLAQFAPPATSAVLTPETPHDNAYGLGLSPDDSDEEYVPTLDGFASTAATASAPQVQGSSLERTVDPRLSRLGSNDHPERRQRGRSEEMHGSMAIPQRHVTPTGKPNIDPASITSWETAYRCVIKLATENRQLKDDIRTATQMIQNQRKNEEDWYKERQKLKKTLSERHHGAEKVRGILTSLGSTTTNASSLSKTDAVDDQAELAAFDRKIYAAQIRMNDAMTAQLKGLGVPFFGTDPALTRPTNSTTDVEEKQLHSSRPKWSQPITDLELRKLRSRMVEHLELAYGTQDDF